MTSDTPRRGLVRRGVRARPAGAARAVVAAVALVASALGASSPAAAQAQPFSDTSEDAYYSEAVGALADGGIFEGTECAEGMLCPGEPIDRQTMAVWTVRALDGQDPAPIANSRFSDVAADSFHGPFIERMAELGVTAGCGDGTTFCPDGTVTRDQMAVFLTRAFDLEPGPAPGFSDVAADAWYYNEVVALAASAITVGCGDGTTFCPDDTVTRAQMATFLARASGLVGAPEGTADGDTSFVAVDVGGWSACAVAADGRLVCWGTAAFSTDERFISVDLGRLFSGCGVRLDGTIFCWPEEGFGEVTPPAGQYTDVSIAGGRLCAVGEDQSIACWGTPDGVEPWDVPDGTYVAVDVGHVIACGLRTDQTIVCWGKRGDADSAVTVWALDGRYTAVQLFGRGVCGVRTDQTVTCTEPKSRDGPGRHRYRDWAPGSWASCGVRVDGTVHCPNAPTHYGHHIVPGGGPFTDVVGREQFGCGLRADGTVACWGAYDGRGAPEPPSGHYTDIAVGYFGACGLRVDGTVVCWGDDRAGQRDVPAGRFKAISRGWVHACGLRPDGTVTCWGANIGGQLDVPQGRFVDVAGGGAHVRTPSGAVVGPSGFSCGVRSDSTIVCWGSSLGALDPPDGEYTEVVAGWQHACGLRVDGSITCWLGGFPVGRIQPVTVPGPFKALDESGQPCGLRTDNTVVCWHEYYESGKLDLETKAENVIAYSGPFYVDEDGAIRYETGRRLFAP